MSGFSLLSLVPSHLEKVINKLQDKSYFRLQQTCWILYDFIRTNKNIFVYTDGYFELYFDNKTFSWQFYYRKPIAMRDLYGTRLRLIFSCHREAIKSDNVEKLQNLLKMHKITGVTVSIYFDPSLLTSGNEVELWKLLRPSKIYAHDEYLPAVSVQLSDFEKKIDICRAETVTIPFGRFLTTIEETKIRIILRSNPLILFRKALESLLSTQFPKARLFHLDIEKIGWNIRNDELEDDPLPGFNLTISAKSGKRLKADVPLPQQFHSSSSCKILISLPVYSLRYNSF